MPGERYFAARDRLAEISACIAELARETALEIPQHDPTPDLHQPILLAAIGEVNAGKSALLNAIAGTPLCPAGPLPLTTEVRHYRYGPVIEDRPCEGYLECRRPVAFLKDFELLDTPGTNVATKPQIAAAEPFLDRAELVMVVFTAENPWTAPTWDAVGRLTDESLERALLVVQRADLKQAQDIPVILGHMRDLCLKRIGRELPIFPVAARLALEAKTASSWSAEAWSMSRFAAFEKRLTEHVCESFARRQILHDAWHHAARTLRRLEESFDRQRRTMEDDGWFLSGIEREMDGVRDEFVRAAPTSLAGVKERYHGVARGIAGHLRGRLGWLRTLVRLFTGDASAGGVEALFASRMQELVSVFGAGEAQRLIAACSQHWEGVRPRVSERMGFDPGPCDIAGQGQAAATQRFVGRLENAVPQALAGLRVRGVLDPMLRRRNSFLKTFVAVGLLLVIAAGASGALGARQIPFYLLGAAIAVFAVSAVAAWTTRGNIAKEYRLRLSDSSSAFVDGLQADYSEAIRTLFSDHSQGLIDVRRRLAAQKAALQPRLQRWSELFLALKAVELEM